MNSEFSYNLKSLPNLIIKENESLKNYSYWKIGGPADFFIEPININGLISVLKLLRQTNLPTIIIGSGSNLLFDDAGIRGVIIHIGKYLSQVEINDTTIIAESGIYVPYFARLTQTYGLSGLEHIVGIPGTLGGLVAMNGGSMRKGIDNSIIQVETLNSEGETCIYSKKECMFGYRSSIFQKNENIITKIKLKLEKKEPSLIRDEMLEILKTRNAKFPRKMPSCGSVFLSTPENYGKLGTPGFIIESLKMKGLKFGDAQISPHHANFIVNLGNAKHTDVLKLVHSINQKCLQTYGFKMKAESKFISQYGKQINLDEA